MGFVIEEKKGGETQEWKHKGLGHRSDRHESNGFPDRKIKDAVEGGKGDTSDLGPADPVCFRVYLYQFKEMEKIGSEAAVGGCSNENGGV